MIPNKQGIIAGSSQSSQFKQIYTITYGDFATNKQSQFFQGPQGPPVLMNKNRLQSLFPIQATVTTPVNITLTTVTSYNNFNINIQPTWKPSIHQQFLDLPGTGTVDKNIPSQAPASGCWWDRRCHPHLAQCLGTTRMARRMESGWHRRNIVNIVKYMMMCLNIMMSPCVLLVYMGWNIDKYVTMCFCWFIWDKQNG